jgi:hypothetical protein
MTPARPGRMWGGTALAFFALVALQGTVAERLPADILSWDKQGRACVNDVAIQLTPDFVVHVVVFVASAPSVALHLS